MIFTRPGPFDFNAKKKRNNKVATECSHVCEDGANRTADGFSNTFISNCQQFVHRSPLPLSQLLLQSAVDSADSFSRVCVCVRV